MTVEKVNKSVLNNQKSFINEQSRFKNSYQTFYDNQSPCGGHNFCKNALYNCISNTKHFCHCEAVCINTPQNKMKLHNYSKKISVFHSAMKINGIGKKKKDCKRLSKKTTYNINWGVMAFLSMYSFNLKTVSNKYFFNFVTKILNVFCENKKIFLSKIFFLK